jgi:hypothetical protein
VQLWWLLKMCKMSHMPACVLRRGWIRAAKTWHVWWDTDECFVVLNWKWEYDENKGWRTEMQNMSKGGQKMSKGGWERVKDEVEWRRKKEIFAVEPRGLLRGFLLVSVSGIVVLWCILNNFSIWVVQLLMTDCLSRSDFDFYINTLAKLAANPAPN